MIAANHSLEACKGLRFLHSRVLRDDYKTPMEFVVTKVAKGTVYYRPVDGGAPNCCPVEEFSKWCKEIV